MRKGSKRNDWSYSEERYLIENAGLIPRREICEKLKRSRKSVQRKCDNLRAQGLAISLRCYKPKLSACPSCGCLRSSLGVLGVCIPCRLRFQVEGTEADVSELLQRLPFEVRDVYAETEADRLSRSDPMPRAPLTEGLSRYEAAREREKYDRELEEWAIANLTRRADAARQRKKNIKEKLESLQINGDLD